MGKKNRDDFSASVKNKAAQRTGYRCSICSISTIGPSHKSNKSTSSIGEASHICAAAPNGARYDSNMTPEERSSIDNCIWLCKIHARAIDVDEAKYPVEHLKELKKKAEKYAEASISEVDMFRNEYNISGDDVTSLCSTFHQMVSMGSFDLLRNILERYTNTISSAYDELVLRFKLIYDFYCNRSMIEGHLDEYIKLPIHSGVDYLLECAVSFDLFYVVEKLLPLSTNEEINKVAQLLLEGNLESSLIGKQGTDELFQVSQEQQNMVNNYVIQKAVGQNMFRLRTVSGEEYKFASNEAYFKLLFAAYRLVGRIVYNDSSMKKAPEDSDFWEICKNINIIVQLDASIQDFLWESVLHFSLEEREKFNELVKQVPVCVHEMPRISKLLWLNKLRYEISSVDVDELLTYSKNNKNFVLLSRYLWLIPESERYAFLKDHMFLCKTSSRFLQMVLEYEEKHNVCTVKLSDYEVAFREDFLYMCLKYGNTPNPSEKREIVDWLLKHQDLLLVEDLHLYIDILYAENKLDDVIKISAQCIHNEHLFHIANLLCRSREETYAKKGRQIYELLEEKGWKHQGLFLNMAIVYSQTGKIEKAKKYFKKEYDEHDTSEALFHLLRLRVDTNDVRDDEYLHKAKAFVTLEFQNIIAASYDKMANYTEAKLYVLRTLLIDETAGCMGALFHLNLEDEPAEGSPGFVQKDCVCVLKSKTESINVAIHDERVLKGINPNNFANCLHYTSGDSIIASLMYAKKDDVVYFKGKEYIIIDIESTSSFCASYALKQIVAQNKGIQTIQASTPDEFISNITEYLAKSKNETDRMLNSYNSSEVRPPLSIFSSAFGKENIEACEFMAYGNSEKTRNNSTYEKTDATQTFILSLDSIVNLVLSGCVDVPSNEIKIMCAQQVKNCLINEINKIIANLNSKKSQGKMVLVDDRAQFFERTLELRRDRYSFVSQIKAFVESLPEVEGYDFETSKLEFESLFTEGKMEIEAATLALLQNTHNAVLVTDDQCLFVLADLMGYSNMGLCGFLTNLSEDSIRLIEISKKLKSINFANYVPWFLFDKTIDCLSNIQEQEERDRISCILSQWLMSDRDDGEATDHHREVVIQLYRDFVNLAGATVSVDYPLTQIAIHHFTRLHPEYVNKMIEDFSKNLTITVSDDLDNNEEDP